jgi:hypothetical protein
MILGVCVKKLLKPTLRTIICVGWNENDKQHITNHLTKHLKKRLAIIPPEDNEDVRRAKYLQNIYNPGKTSLMYNMDTFCTFPCIVIVSCSQHIAWSKYKHVNTVLQVKLSCQSLEILDTLECSCTFQR